MLYYTKQHKCDTEPQNMEENTLDGRWKRPTPASSPQFVHYPDVFPQCQHLWDFLPESFKIKVLSYVTSTAKKLRICFAIGYRYFFSLPLKIFLSMSILKKDAFSFCLIGLVQSPLFLFPAGGWDTTGVHKRSCGENRHSQGPIW